MKSEWLIILLALVIASNNTNAQLFQQDFNSSSILTDYFNSTPTTNQFRNISATNALSEVAIVNNKLVFSRLGGATTVAYAERNVDFATTPSALKIQFKFAVSGGSAGTNVFALAVGSDVSNSGTPPTITNLFGRISFNTTSNEGEFTIRDVTGKVSGSNTYTGAQNILWVLNNSGESQSYLGPIGEYESIADDKADIWVGTTKEFDEIIVDNPNQNLSRFKFYTNSSWTVGSTITIDDIIIENESALPVQLTYFNGSWLNKEVVLSWQTATEINNYGFDVERRLLDSDALSLGNSSLKSKWEIIGFVHGNGNSHSPKNYSYTDNLSNTNNYLPALLQYRLKQIDFDGRFEYSGIVDINFEMASQFKLEQNYPNPFNPETTIKFSIPAGVETSYMTSLRVYDILGREIATLVNEAKLPGNYSTKFSFKDIEKDEPLSTSIYFYKLQTGNFTQVKKMILMK